MLLYCLLRRILLTGGNINDSAHSFPKNPSPFLDRMRDLNLSRGLWRLTNLLLAAPDVIPAATFAFLVKTTADFCKGSPVDQAHFGP